MDAPDTDRLVLDVQPAELQIGRWYSATLSDGTVVVLQAGHTGRREHGWFLAQPGSRYPETPRSARLFVRPDGRLERDDGADPGGPGIEDRVVAEGLTASDLVPANAIAQAAWVLNVGPCVACPRCKRAAPEPHDPLCHDEHGIPLFAGYGRTSWRRALDRHALHLVLPPLRRRNGRYVEDDYERRWPL